MAEGTLFGSDFDLTPVKSEGHAQPVGEPRLVRADRLQMRLEPRSLDELIPDEHRVRAIWAAVGKLDLSAFCREVRARGSHPGRPAIDPRILICLWLYAPDLFT